MNGAVDSYIALAREDLAAAKALIAEFPRPAAFHISQAAEKLIKAVLTAEGIAFPVHHHQLGALAALLPADHIWRADLAAFDAFTSYATAVRYPKPGGGIPKAPDGLTLRAAWNDVHGLLDEIEDWCRGK